MCSLRFTYHALRFTRVGVEIKSSEDAGASLDCTTFLSMVCPVLSGKI